MSWHQLRSTIFTAPIEKIRRHRNHRRQLAVLIDADNVSPQYAADVFVEVAIFGNPVTTRIYGNFTSMPHGWGQFARSHASRAIQCFHTANKKNSADIALAVDAVQLMHCDTHLAGFCIVSSDADFSPLAALLKASGKAVYVFGSQSTPEVLRSACTRFIPLEALASRRHGLGEEDAKRWCRPITDAERVLYPAVMSLGGGHSPVSIRAIGTQIRRLESDFDPRNYRCRTLRELLVQCELFDVKGEKEATTVMFRPPPRILPH